MRAHRLFSSKSRPIHYGNYPLHRLQRTDDAPELAGLAMPTLTFRRPEDPESIVNAMAEHQAMLDTIRDGLVNGARADIPEGPEDRSNHLKSFGESHTRCTQNILIFMYEAAQEQFCSNI